MTATVKAFSHNSVTNRSTVSLKLYKSGTWYVWIDGDENPETTTPPNDPFASYPKSDNVPEPKDMEIDRVHDNGVSYYIHVQRNNSTYKFTVAALLVEEGIEFGAKENQMVQNRIE